MKKVLLFMGLFIGISWIAQAQNAILGEWLTPNGDAKVLIYRKGTEGNDVYGKLIWTKKASEGVQTVADSEAALIKQEDVNTEVLEGFDYTGNNTWEYGKLVDPQNGKTYNCILRLKNPEELEVQIYRSILPIAKKVTWTRSDYTAQHYHP